jgi:hypothetical protein
VTWFRVDDSLHDHSKVRKVAAKAPAALALWLIAGSWSSRKLTEGFIPDDDLPWLIPGAEGLATELVAARLWRRVKGGHQFHDWLSYNPSKEKVEAERAAAAERMRKLRERRSGEHAKGSRARSGERTGAPRGNFDHSQTSFRSSTAAKCERHPGSLASNCAGCRSEVIGGTA